MYKFKDSEETELNRLICEIGIVMNINQIKKGTKNLVINNCLILFIRMSGIFIGGTKFQERFFKLFKKIDDDDPEVVDYLRTDVLGEDLFKKMKEYKLKVC